MKSPEAIGAIFLMGLVAIGCGDDGRDKSSAGSGAATATGAGGGSAGGAGGTGAASTSATSTGSVGGGPGSGGGGAVWQPAQGASWQWQLSGSLDLSFDVGAYDIDMNDVSDGELSQLKSAGRAIICYFSAGSWEAWREDAGSFPASVKGSPLDAPFTDELWLDIRSPVVRDLMAARLDKAVTRGCDAVEPDNVDGFANNNGFGLSPADQLDFNAWIAEQAHARGLSVGLKNDLDQLDALEPLFDWALNEECFSYDECDAYSGNFLAAGKAVFHAEYVSASQLNSVCAVTKPLGLSTLIKNIDLDAYQLTCP